MPCSSRFCRTCRRMLLRWGWRRKALVGGVFSGFDLNQGRGGGAILTIMAPPNRRKPRSPLRGTAEPQAAPSPTADAQQTTDGFQLVIDALKLNGLDTIYGL